MSGPTLARLVAALGAVCGIAALWTNAGALGSGASAYFDDGTLGATMLATALAVLVLLAAAQRTGRRGFDMAGVGVGGFLFGLFLYNPVFWSPKTLGHLGPAAWLGLCTALTPLALLSLPPAEVPQPVRRALRLVGAAVVGVGVAAVVVGATRVDARELQPGYWRSLIQELGICLIVLAAAAAILVAVSLARPAPFASDAALAFAGATLGFATYVPASVAFGHFGYLGAGIWLAFGGAALLLLGVLLERGSFRAFRRGA